MRYAHVAEDLRAIESLLEAGIINLEEAHEMREYITKLIDKRIERTAA